MHQLSTQTLVMSAYKSVVNNSYDLITIVFLLKWCSVIQNDVNINIIIVIFQLYSQLNYIFLHCKI